MRLEQKRPGSITVKGVFIEKLKIFKKNKNIKFNLINKKMKVSIHYLLMKVNLLFFHIKQIMPWWFNPF